MTVAAILASKGRDVVTASPERTLAEICGLLAKKRIGAVVLTDGRGGITGIVSERDIVRALASGGADALSSRAADHMTRDVVTCTPEDSVHRVMERMTSGRFRHVPVLEAGRLAGIVSIGDVVKHRIAQVEQEAEQMRTYIATA